MEEHNEYGNGVEDLVRRSDVEYWLARKEEEREQERGILEDDDHRGLDDSSEYQDWGGEMDLRDAKVGRKYVKSRRGRGERAEEGKTAVAKRMSKTLTGREMKERIEEKNNLKEVEKGKKLARRLRREGKMREISSYFVRRGA
jgi:hypothetical protein